MRVADDIPENLAEAATQPGALIVEKHRVLARCGGDTFVELLKVQQQGKKMMDADAWARGAEPQGKVLV